MAALPLSTLSIISISTAVAHSPQQWLREWRRRATASTNTSQAKLQYMAPSQSHAAGAIPAHIYQLSNSPLEELETNGQWMQRWWQLNPDYHYHLFAEDDCIQFIHLFGELQEIRAYNALRLGSQRADMCRMSLLLRLGGVYADTDVEPTVPLRLLLPPEATAVIIPSPSPQKFSNPGNGSAQTELAAILENTSNPEVNTDRFPIHWVYTLLPMAAGHPFAAEHLNSIIDAVLHQQQLLDRGPLAAACNSSRSCVLRISGPIAWTKSWLRVARRLCPSADGAAWPCLVSSHVLEFALATKLLTRNQAINRTSSAMAPHTVHHTCANKKAGGQKACANTHYRNMQSAVDAFAPPRGEALYWLHIGKCGSTFLASIMDVACPTSWRNATDSLPTGIFKQLQNMKQLSSQCSKEPPTALKAAARLDVEIRRRCSLSEYFTTDSDIGLPFAASGTRINPEWFQGRVWASMYGECSILGAPQARLASSPFDFSRVVMMVREPLSRLVSSYQFGMHDLTFNNHSLKQQLHSFGSLKERVVFFALHACGMQARSIAGAVLKTIGGRLLDPRAAMASLSGPETPAEWGCTAAGLARSLGFWRKLQHSGSAEVANWLANRKQELHRWQTVVTPRLTPRAIERLRAAAFVGITGDWERSICLFYQLYGGSGARKAGKAQLQKKRAQDSAEEHREAETVRGILEQERLAADPIDDAVYTTAQRLFEERAALHGCV